MVADLDLLPVEARQHIESFGDGALVDWAERVAIQIVDGYVSEKRAPWLAYESECRRKSQAVRGCI